jgi:hypothetical protein
LQGHKPARSVPTQGCSRQAIHGLLAHGPHPCGPPSGSSFDRQSGKAKQNLGIGIGIGIGIGTGTGTGTGTGSDGDGDGDGDGSPAGRVC